MNIPHSQALAQADVLLDHAIAGRLDALHEQLSLGVDPRPGESSGNTALHLLLSARVAQPVEAMVKAVHALADAGVPVNARNLLHACALHVAAEFQAWPVVRALLDHGADPFARDGNGHLPEEVARYNLTHRGVAEGLAEWCRTAPPPSSRAIDIVPRRHSAG